MTRPIYFDCNATTPVEKAAVERMIPFFTEEYGNPSNTSHVYGWAADEAAQLAREQIAALVGAGPDEVVFTSGATEAINAAVKGIAEAYSGRGKHILTCATEHKAVLEACRSLKPAGFEVTELPVDENGLVSGDDVRAALRDDTILVALMWANNETGVIHPMGEIADALADHQAFLFSDATQAVGKVPVSMDGVDLMACSAHKFYGPKGVGALIVDTQSPPIRLPKLLHGGAQESGRRSGTLNVPGIVGMGEAARIAADRLEADAAAMRARRDRFENELLDTFRGAFVNGAGADRLPQTSNVSFPGVKAGEMITEIGRLAVSTGSACASGSGAPSHVLSAMGLSKDQAAGTVRFSMGRHTTEDDVDEALGLLRAYAEKHGLSEQHAAQPAL